MKGFRDFVLRGNVIDLAVAVIIGGAFATVVQSVVTLILDIVSAAIGGEPNFDSVTVAGIAVGPVITAVVSFLILAFAVYVLIVKPYEMVQARRKAAEEPAAPDETVLLLTEIRDELRQRN